MARGMWKAEVTSSQRSPGFASTSPADSRAFSAVFRLFSSIVTRASGIPISRKKRRAAAPSVKPSETSSAEPPLKSNSGRMAILSLV